MFCIMGFVTGGLYHGVPQNRGLGNRAFRNCIMGFHKCIVGVRQAHARGASHRIMGFHKQGFWKQGFSRDLTNGLYHGVCIIGFVTGGLYHGVPQTGVLETGVFA